jgi:hypothetical protein
MSRRSACQQAIPNRKITHVTNLGAVTCAVCLAKVEEMRNHLAGQEALRRAKPPLEQSAVVIFRRMPNFWDSEKDDPKALLVYTRSYGNEDAVIGVLAAFAQLIEQAENKPTDAPAAAALFFMFIARRSMESSITDIPWTISSNLLGMTLFPDNTYELQIDPNGVKRPSIHL